MIWEESATVNDTFNAAILRIDNDNLVCHIYVCPNLSVDVLQFIKPAYRTVFMLDDKPALKRKILVHEIEGRRAIGSDKTLPISGQSPTFTRIFPRRLIFQSLLGNILVKVGD